jgi:hypothetical protein
MGVNSNNYMGRTKQNLGSGPFLNRQMAKEGIIIGGTNQPLIMSGGGFIDKYPVGGQKKTKEQLQKEIDAKKYKDNTKKVKEFEKDVDVFEVDGKKIGARGTSSQQQKDLNFNARKKPYVYDKGKEEAYIKSLCERMKNGDLRGYTVADLVTKNLIVAGAAPKLAGCETKSESDVTEFFELEDTPEQQEVQKCYCKDPETGEEVEVALTNGKCECEEEYQGEYGYGDQQQGSGAYFPEWTTQDKLNLAGAMRIRTGIEYPTAMTYQYPEVELPKEEWLSKVQSLQGQAAKNLDAMNRSAGSSTAKQAMNASLYGDVGEAGVTAIADTQAKNRATEAQERLTNYQGDVAEGTNRASILNQNAANTDSTENNYRGELNAKDAVPLQMINKGLQNAADIYNLQTEQYAFDPRTGMQIFKGGKPFDPSQPDQDIIAYAKELEASHLPEDVQELILKQRLSRYGGPVYQIGGMVYGDSVYPFYYPE